jgi:hypothetical protein
MAARTWRIAGRELDEAIKAGNPSAQVFARRALLNRAQGNLDFALADAKQHPLRAQLVLHRHKKVEKGVPGIGDVGELVARLLDQRPPEVERPGAWLAGGGSPKPWGRVRT